MAFHNEEIRDADLGLVAWTCMTFNLFRAGTNTNIWTFKVVS